MITHPIWAPVKDWADLQVTFQLAEGLLDSLQIFVIAQDLFFGALARFQTGVQKVQAVQSPFGVDQLLIFVVLQLAFFIDPITEVLVRFELVQSAADLTG